MSFFDRSEPHTRDYHKLDLSTARSLPRFCSCQLAACQPYSSRSTCVLSTDNWSRRTWLRIPCDGRWHEQYPFPDSAQRGISLNETRKPRPPETQRRSYKVSSLSSSPSGRMLPGNWPVVQLSSKLPIFNPPIFSQVSNTVPSDAPDPVPQRPRGLSTRLRDPLPRLRSALPVYQRRISLARDAFRSRRRRHAPAPYRRGGP